MDSVSAFELVSPQSTPVVSTRAPRTKTATLACGLCVALTVGGIFITKVVMMTSRHFSSSMEHDVKLAMERDKKDVIGKVDADVKDMVHNTEETLHTQMTQEIEIKTKEEQAKVNENVKNIIEKKMELLNKMVKQAVADQLLKVVSVEVDKYLQKELARMIKEAVEKALKGDLEGKVENLKKTLEGKINEHVDSQIDATVNKAFDGSKVKAELRQELQQFVRKEIEQSTPIGAKTEKKLREEIKQEMTDLVVGAVAAAPKSYSVQPAVDNAYYYEPRYEEMFPDVYGGGLGGLFDDWGW